METYGKVQDLFSLNGRSAVVTGGSRGLGAAMATALLENGCDVFIVCRNTDRCKELVDFAAGIGRRCIPYSCDVTDSVAVAGMAENAKASLGKIDILINSAGINILKFLHEMDDDSWKNVMRANIDATFYTIREVSKYMIPQGSGRIINMSSMKAFLGASDMGYSAYCTSKGAVNMLTKQIACELARYNITCNAMAPTFIKTDINAKQLDNVDFRRELENRIPLGRIGKASDLVGLMLFLVSDAASFVTGQTIPLDGGILARQ